MILCLAGWTDPTCLPAKCNLIYAAKRSTLSSFIGTLPDNFLLGFAPGHVEGLTIGGNKLSGLLPPAWGLSGRLFDELDLSKNLFNGKFYWRRHLSLPSFWLEEHLKVRWKLAPAFRACLRPLTVATHVQALYRTAGEQPCWEGENPIYQATNSQVLCQQSGLQCLPRNG